MATELTWQGRAVQARIVERLKRNIDKAAIHVQRSIKDVLSSPGSGKLYRRSEGKKTGRNLRAKGWHRASAPGEAPAADTGELRRRTQVDLTEIDDLRAYVGTKVPYAAALEFGAPGRGLAPRPYMRVGMELARERAEEIVRSGIK